MFLIYKQFYCKYLTIFTFIELSLFITTIDRFFKFINIFLIQKFFDPIDLNFVFFFVSGILVDFISTKYFWNQIIPNKLPSLKTLRTLLRFLPCHLNFTNTFHVICFPSEILYFQMIPPSGRPCVRIVYNTGTCRNYNTQLHRAFVRRAAAWPLINLVCMSECFSSRSHPLGRNISLQKHVCVADGEGLWRFSRLCV